MSSKEQGITLIEILITISMITILLGVVFWGYRERGREFDLRRSALELVVNLEKTREMAMSARIASGEIERPAGGYGLRFEKDSQNYIIFVDTNTDKDYDIGEEIEELILKQRIIIKSLSPPHLDDVVDIVFIPPSPDVYINGSVLVNAEIELALINDLNKTEKIIINPAGLISIED